MTEISFRDHHEFAKLVEPLPTDARALVAARLGLRAFPAVGVEASLTDIAPVMRCAILVHAAACGGLEMDAALGDDARAAADGAVEASFRNGVSAWAANAATKSASVLWAEMSGRRAAALRHLTGVLIDAESAVRELAGAREDAGAHALYRSASSDVHRLTRGDAAQSVAGLPLWSDAAPISVQAAWDALRSRLSASDARLRDWAVWYDARLAGGGDALTLERALAPTWRN